MHLREIAFINKLMWLSNGGFGLSAVVSETGSLNTIPFKGVHLSFNVYQQFNYFICFIRCLYICNYSLRYRNIANDNSIVVPHNYLLKMQQKIHGTCNNFLQLQVQDWRTYKNIFEQSLLFSVGTYLALHTAFTDRFFWGRKSEP